MNRKGKGNGMNVKFQVLGFRNFNRKSDGKAMTIITCMSACTQQDNASGNFGNRSTDFFLPDDKVGSLTVDCIGQEFVPIYGINGFGRPTLENFEFKKWA